ncbi:MAG: 50S ribosomal protein L15 [Phycisphaerae bacterium]|nr:50S ribosomal protein L15 [Phycisphaerae bacterium]
MKLDDILSAAGKYKRRKRIGRGTGSGHGKTSGRGHKGYGARAGAKCRAGYEGGQSPMLSRIPKRGFNNANFRKEYQIVNLADLEEAFDDGARVAAETLRQAGLIDDPAKPVKILGDGELKKKLTVVANKFSAKASERIVAAGGVAEEIPVKAPKPRNKQKSARAAEGSSEES